MFRDVSLFYLLCRACLPGASRHIAQDVGRGIIFKILKRHGPPVHDENLVQRIWCAIPMRPRIPQALFWVSIVSTLAVAVAVWRKGATSTRNVVPPPWYMRFQAFCITSFATLPPSAVQQPIVVSHK